ncbi:MAG TPA: folylpolyglutamate synthase/dihydrofolate synthase family protein [Candidatus Binatia bacterium]|jgi:dihydrofolate synthase/folylpolyglutamate synthase
MRSYAETLDYIYNLRGGEIDLKLDRMDRALTLFDRPERSYPSFHIAGTNGKGSTAAMLHRILTLAGYRTALYTSPHITSFTERIRVRDREISEEEVVELADEIERRTAGADIRLTFFEIITVMAFVHFARRNVDVAVVEVGLGGRLDATNFVTSCVSIITTIAKDHEAYLGSELLSIAREKGGIIKPGVPLVGGRFAPEIQGLFEDTAHAKQAASYFLGRDFSASQKADGRFDYSGLHGALSDVSLGLAGRHQRSNAALALCALEVARAEFPVSVTSMREGLATVFWPGRLETVLERPTVILDGAHNEEGIKTLTAEMRERLGAKKATVVFAAMADKDWRLMLRELSAVAGEFVLTRVAMDRSADSEEMAASARAAAAIPVKAISDARQAVLTTIQSASPEDVVLITGSLYFLGEVRSAVMSLAPPRDNPRGPLS